LPFRSLPTPLELNSRSYLPALDGLRALAVIGVLIYHARPNLLPGGFLGVEVFFVISGFIITRALLNEWQENGRIALAAFWLRRARRLLPAVFLVLAATMVYVTLFQPEELTRLRGDVLASLAYVTNWHLVMANQSYFDTFQQPSMLRHLWSLAVEEQFYLVWPLIIAAGLPILKRRMLFVLIIAGIAASTAGMALLYTPGGDTSRVYFGTDTRAAGLLVGAALAFLVAGRSVGRTNPMLLRALALCGIGFLALIAGATVWLDETQPQLYRGGFLAVSLMTAAVILASTRPGVFSTLLALPPLRWLGVRSYGIYLWHWPIYMLVWPHEPTLGQLAGQIVAVVLISALSYSLLEKPVREGALGRLWSQLRDGSRAGILYRGSLVFSGTGAAALVVSLALIAVQARAPELPDYFQTASLRLQSSNIVASDTGSTVPGQSPLGRVQTTITSLTTESGGPCAYEMVAPTWPPSRTTGPASSACSAPTTLFDPPIVLPQEEPPVAAVTLPPVEEAPASPAAKAPTPVAPPSPPPPAPGIVANALRVTAIGDSVMLGAAYTLARSIPGIDVDSAVGRQASSIVDILRERVKSGQAADVLLIHVGNNGTLTTAQFEEIMQLAGPRRVIFVNIMVPRAWQDSNNAVLNAGVARYANATIIDWYSASIGHPEYFASDGIHLLPSGASVYAQLVINAILG
jgi:peptidoglycan/LPS O-acetylase OafA/YrhL